MEPGSGAMIATASGQVAVAQLGATLVAEHVLLGLPGFSHWEEEHHGLSTGEREQAGLALARLRDLGVETIVDETPIGYGRDPALAAELATAAGLRLVLGVGVAGGLGAFAELSGTELAEVYLAELSGSGASGIAAAVLTIEHSIEPDDFVALTAMAVAFAHAETQAPVLMRARGSGAHLLAERLVSHGVDPDRIMVAGVDHSGASWSELSALARIGVHLGVTGIGRDEEMEPGARASLFAYLLRTYGAERVGLAMGSWAHWRGARGLPAGATIDPKRGFAALADFRSNALVYGISGEDFDAALVRAPRSWLGG